METIRFVLAVPSLYRNDDVWYKFVKYNWPNLEKNKKDFQNWKNFYFFLLNSIKLLRKDFNYIYTMDEIEMPDQIYNRLRYNACPVEKTFSDYLQYTCQQNTC